MPSKRKIENEDENKKPISVFKVVGESRYRKDGAEIFQTRHTVLAFNDETQTYEFALLKKSKKKKEWNLVVSCFVSRQAEMAPEK